MLIADDTFRGADRFRAVRLIGEPLIDNWANEVPCTPQPAVRDRFAAALWAYYEKMPLRRSPMPTVAAAELYITRKAKVHNLFA